MPGIIAIPVLLSALLILTSCSGSAHQIRDEVPSELEQQIDTSVTFVDLQAAPADYIGRLLTIGGVVISAKRTKTQTEIAILQLPTESEGRPTRDRRRSEGRFLAVREAFLDPATVPPGTSITIIGVVQNATTRPLDESSYTYPILEIKHLIDWSTVASRRSERGYYGPYYAPFGYWGGGFGFRGGGFGFRGRRHGC